MTATEPTAEILPMPTGYGTAEGTMSWETVRQKLTEAKQYWFASNRPDGRNPHVVPLDGVWLDDRWYHGGSPETLHRKLVAKNPQVTMHLPHAWDVVIVEGVVERLELSPEDGQRLAEAFATKYPEYGEADAESWRRPDALLPRKVLAWSEFPKDTTRFRFD